MVNPIEIASGLLNLATIAFASSATLAKTVKSYQYRPHRVRELIEELEALNAALLELTDTLSAVPDVDLSDLDHPLLRCGTACRQFEQELIKCSSKSGYDQIGFRDWAKLRYMGDNIDDFRRLLAGYKSIITVALTSANLHKTSITAGNIRAYRDLIKNTTDDLEARLQSIDEKLETIAEKNTTGFATGATELQVIKDERQSTQKCLQICAQSSESIDHIKLAPENDGSSAEYMGADANLKENISTIENYATGNAIQFMVSTNGRVIHGINRGLGPITRQAGGHFNDTSFQQLSRDFVRSLPQNVENEPPVSGSSTPVIPADVVEQQLGSEFRERYGPGIKLSRNFDVNAPLPSAGRADGRHITQPKG